MMRAMWKGIVQLGEASVPVKLYAAIEDRKVHFRLLHEADQAPVRQEMVDPQSGEPVAREEVLRGLPLADGRVVVLTDEERASIAPEPSRDIEVLRCVPREAIADPWFDRPYWLGPDGDAGAYAALVAALAESDRVAVVRWTMRNQHYQGAIFERDGRLALVRLKHAEEIVSLEGFEAPSGRAATKKELALAEQLVDALAGDFDPELLRDTYQERVRELVAAKAEGKVVRMPKRARKKKPEASMEEALSASLRAVAGKRR